MRLQFPSKFVCLCLLAGLDALGLRAASASASAAEFAAASPLFKEFCFKCHSDKKTKAALNLEHIASAPDFAMLFKTWDKVILRLEANEMPPEDERQPSDAQ